MSYDLYFWRQSPSLAKTPGEVLALLSEDKPIQGIATWPDALVRRLLRDAFPEIKDEGTQLIWESEGSYFLVSFGHANEWDIHLITASCGFKLLENPDVLNRLIDACNQLGFALYDSQTGQRYEQPEPR